MKKLNMLSKLNEKLWRVFGYTLLASPFAIGYYLWILLLPVTCIEKILSIILILGICSVESLFAWWIGLSVLDD